LPAIGGGLIGHAAKGTAGFADEKQIAGDEIARLLAAFALRRTGGGVGCVLDEMHLRPVGNDFCDRDRMRHVEADAEAVAGIFVASRQTGHQRHDESDNARASLNSPHAAQAK
jgi:hypothetical protein